MRRLLWLVIGGLILEGCAVPEEKRSNDADTTRVELETSYGTIEIALSNYTPKHKANFINIVEDGVLDSVLFHRVIETFMAQAGDINSKSAEPDDTLGSGDLPYRVAAEFHSSLYHRRGAVGAARNTNSQRASSSTQFYIVQGRTYSDSALDVAQSRINHWLAMNRWLNAAPQDSLRKEYDKAVDEESALFSELYQHVDSMARTLYKDSVFYQYPEAHRRTYSTTGGAAHLDQNYTVFGHVTKGMEVIDAIAAQETNELDRPIRDIRIISARILTD